MTDYKGIDPTELHAHHDQLLHHICGGLGGSTTRQKELKTLMGGMLGAGADLDHGHGSTSFGFKRQGKVTPDEFKQIVDTLVASKKIYTHEAEEMHRRAADALSD